MQILKIIALLIEYPMRLWGKSRGSACSLSRTPPCCCRLPVST